MTKRQDARDAWTSFGNRACLVNSERYKLSNSLKKGAALDEHSAASRRRKAPRRSTPESKSPRRNGQAITSNTKAR